MKIEPIDQDNVSGPLIPVACMQFLPRIGPSKLFTCGWTDIYIILYLIVSKQKLVIILE